VLIAALGVVAALAFVLGLGALCLWGLKRWGRMSLTSRTRVAVEVVQRVPLGPKTGMAVIRVGEKVMAVSVGDGGVRPLFELDEADRLRVIATSNVPTPMESSAAAASAFSKFLPGAFGKAMTQAMQTTPESPAVSTPVATYAAPSSVFAVASSAVGPSAVGPSAVGPSARAQTPHTQSAHATMVFSASEAREIPSFLTAPIGTVRTNAPRAPLSHADREFRAMLGGALSGATRLAVFAGAMVLASAVFVPLHAQTDSSVSKPPVVQPPTVQPPAAPDAPKAFKDTVVMPRSQY